MQNFLERDYKKMYKQNNNMQKSEATSSNTERQLDY